MTISKLTLKSRNEEPGRRLEIFTGSGRRREWLPDEKARIVAESYEVDVTVSAVAGDMPCTRSSCSRGVGPLVDRGRVAGT